MKALALLAAAALVATAVIATVSALAVLGRGPSIVEIGRPGTGDGEFREPRGLAVSDRGLAVLDRTGRLQLFDLDGKFVRSVEIVKGNVRRGLPIGVTWMKDAQSDGTHDLAIAHTHESRVIFLHEDGTFVRGFGDEGVAPGKFLMPQRISEDRQGHLLVCDHGIEIHRVQVVGQDGTPVRIIGGSADADGGLHRPMAAEELPDGRTLVADQTAGLVLYAADGKFLGPFTKEKAPEDSIVQGMCRTPDGEVFIADLERAEIRRYGPDGTLLGTFGRKGVALGEFSEPWDVAWRDGWLYIADKENHRVVKVRVSGVDWVKP